MIISCKSKSEETIRPLWIDELYSLGQILRYESTEREIIIYADNTLCISGKFLDRDDELIQSLGIDILRPMKNGGNPDVFRLRGGVRLVVYPGSTLDHKPIDKSPCSVAQCVVRGPHSYHRLAPSKLFVNDALAEVNAVLERVWSIAKVVSLADRIDDSQRLMEEQRRTEQMRRKLLSSLQRFTAQHGRRPKINDLQGAVGLPTIHQIKTHFGKFSVAIHEANLHECGQAVVVRTSSALERDIARNVASLEKLGMRLLQEVF